MPDIPTPPEPIVSSPPHSHLRFFRAIVIGVIFLGLGIGIFGLRNIFQQVKRVNIGASEIQLTAEKSDALGIDPATKFILSSKKPLSLGQVNASLAVSPKSEFSVTGQSDREFQIAFAKPLAANNIYTFALATDSEASISASPSGKLLSWAFQVKTAFRVVQTLPRDKATSVPTNSGIEITFNHDNFENAEKFIEITPKVEGHFEMHKRTLVFAPRELSPATLYTVRVKKGLGVFGTSDTLGEDLVFQFETQDTSSYSQRQQVNFVREMSEFPPSEKPAFSVYVSDGTAKTEPLGVSVFKFADEKAFLASLSERDKIPTWTFYTRNNYRYPTAGLPKIAGFDAPLEQLNYSAYFLFPDPLPAGYYLVEAKANEQTIQSWLAVTDVATYLTTSRTKTLVWVNDLASKAPVTGANIELIGQSSLGKTGTDGTALFDTPKELVDSPLRRYYKITTPTGKTAIVPVSQTNEGYFSRFGGWRSHENAGSFGDDYWAYLYLDRPLYLPTDSVGFWGVIKNRDHPEDPKTVTLVMTRSDYRNYNYDPVTIAARELNLSPYGTFTGELPIKNLETGSYQVEIRKDKDAIIRQSFYVETYTKPAYKIDVESSKRAIFAEESVEFRGKTMFFEGTAVPNVRLKYSGAQEGELTTGKSGEFSLSYTPEYHPPDSKAFVYTGYPNSSYVNFSPALSEEGDIEGYGRVTVFGSHMALNAKSQTLDKTATVTVTANQITIDRLNNGTAKDDSDFLGEPAGSQTITGQLFENHWERKEVGQYYDFVNKVTQKKYDYNLVRSLIRDVALTTDALGKAELLVPLGEDRYYELNLSAKDNEGREARTSVFIYGQSANSSPDLDRYYLDTGQNEETYKYHIGEQVKLAFRNQDTILPTGGDNHYLFRLAQRGIRNYQVQDTAIFSFHFKEADVPNIVAKAIYFNGKTYVESESVSLPFAEKDKSLTVDVKADKPYYGPRDKVNLDVFLTDKNGKAQKGEVNLSLVDEAIFKIQEQSVDLLGDLYRSLESGVIQSYLSHQYPAEIARAEGGGCFLQGTKILAPNNKEIPIENIITGATILTRTSEIDSALVPAKVQGVVKHVVNEYLLINGRMRVTPEHNLYVNGRWMIADEVQIGDRLLDLRNHWIPVRSIERRYGAVTVYNLIVDTYHTFIADGFYVHNQKGRELFTDRAFFGSINTDASGKGKVSFTLPDNLTSWRMTYQGITGDLAAGNSNKLLPVKLPFFVDIVMNTEYLESDAPVISLRAYGEKLAQNQDVNFKIKIPTLSQNESVISGKAFQAIPFTLPKLTEGQHKITVEASAGATKDTITRTFNVYKSRLVKSEVAFAALTSGFHPSGSKGGPTILLFSDANRGKYFPPLTELTYTYGDRVDQKLTRIRARQLLKEYFGEEVYSDEVFKGDTYQQTDGGISLFPYANSDTELSAQVADTAPEYFDRVALAQYFYKILDDQKTDREQGIRALYGLASIGEPVLTAINSISGENDLTVSDKLYIALAQAKIGNRERARELYRQILSESGEKIDQAIRIKTGKDQDDIIKATALAARLGVLLGETEASALFTYINNNRIQEILVYLEEISYLSDTLPNLPGNPVKFSYALNGKKETKTLAKGETFKLHLSPDELASIGFDGIEGNVGVSSFYTAPFDPANISKSGDISLSRAFSANNQSTSTFQEADLVKITMNYSLGAQSVDGCYQVIDFLPSGLRVVSRPYLRGISDDKVWYPYDITNQRVSFCVAKGNYKPIIYYARVLGKGEYQAENALIESMQSPSILNLSGSARVTIK